MIKYVLEKWNSNKDKLEKFYKDNLDIVKDCSYEYIMKSIIDNILNTGINDSIEKFNSDEITVVNNCNYSGLILFIFYKEYPEDLENYFVSNIDYGSCSCCDTLLAAQEQDDEQCIKDIMTISKDICSNIIKIYNDGWRNDSNYDPVTMN